MDRPLADKRPLGPFAARDGGVVFKSTYDATAMSSVSLDTLEDNVQDRLITFDDKVSDVDVSSMGGVEDVTVRVTYIGSSLSDSDEDEMIRIIKSEMERLGASGVRNSSYEYIF